MLNELENMEAAIFDLDGTLVDSMWMWGEIDREYLAKFNIAAPADMQDIIEGMSFTETAAYFKERFALKDSIEKIKQDWNAMAYYKYTNEVPMKNGVREFLDYLKQLGLKLGIATSNSIELVQSIVKVHGLDAYFSVIQTSCDVGKGKPAPDIYLLVAEKLQVCPEKCIAFEDIIPGILSGKAAGMTVCAVEDAYSAGQIKEKKKLADYYIEDYSRIFR